MKVVIFGVVGLLALAPGAWAQEGLATSSTIGGHNTIQQAPSGGRTANGAATGGGDARGAPTAAERQLEKRNNEATQICKGC